MSRRSCVNSPDKFCYICGQYTCEKQRLNINDFVTTAYFNYFGRKIENQDKNWVPHKVCQSCAQFLRLWDTGKIKNLPFNVSSASKPVPVSPTDILPVPPRFDNENSREEELHDNDNNEVDNFEDDDGSPKLLTISQSSLNDLVRELDLPKDKAELLGSRLKERNLLQPDVTFCWYRNREEKFIEFFTDKDSMSYCNNVQGLIEQFGIKYVKALDKEGECFLYLKKKFPSLSEAKIKEGVFIGPQIRTLMKDDNFEKTMNIKEKNGWQSFKKVVKGFLGNNKEENYENLIRIMLQDFKELGCNMSLKLHFLNSHLSFFPQNLGDVSEEQGERFHQDIKNMERRYQGRWNSHMLADYCWNLEREDTDNSYKRKSKSRSFDQKRTRYHTRT
ncbi:hypothetical protein ALC57_13323 [Trachymyrmex cornetzi]|uniref:Uncharacterized protein n=1 Tax=Trachymyrmex cornetzi TaxID=471704 RepID=A0A151IZG3_9HYME|nr:hypothetical protein ALC57_13323 [Trachymyrmex cornetzi]